MAGKRKRSQVSGQDERSTEDANKKRTSRSKNCEIDKEYPPITTPTLALVKSEDAFTNNVKEVAVSLAERDRMCLLNILPEDVWCIIFEKLDNSADLENVSNSSLYFRELLSPQRTQFLFHSVCDRLAKAFTRNHEIYHGRDDVIPPSGAEVSVNSGVNEETIIRRWHKELVKVRLVCRTWSTAVENYYQNHPLHFHKCNSKEIEFIDDFLTVYLYNDIQLLSEMLLDHFSGTHENTTRNPFLGRLFQIGFQKRKGYGFSLILEILQKYGRHIWYCTIYIVDFTSATECYTRVRKLLQLMPNLKVLDVLVANEGLEGLLSELELNELKDNIKGRPMPALPKLQKLSVTGVLPEILLKLLRKNGHISTLHVSGWKSRYRYGIFKVPLPNLKKLKISCYSEAQFLKMDLVDWPLTELDLFLSSSNFIEWQKIFNVLENKFKNTLTRLRLTLPAASEKADKDRIYREGHNFKLNLPHVKSLSVEMSNLSCLDFLLPMRYSIATLYTYISVTDLDNVIRPMEKVEAGNRRILKLLSCVRRPSESNVWTLFPKLDYISYRVSSKDLQIDCDSTCECDWEVDMKCKKAGELSQHHEDIH